MLQSFFRATRGVGIGVLVGVAAMGCALFRNREAAVPPFVEATFAAKPFTTFTIPTPPAGGMPADAIIGSVGSYRIREGDTLMDVARYFDLGFNEIVEANPGVDAWIPTVGKSVVLPTSWVLPCCRYEGLVVNIPEMRLFYYHPEAGGRTTVVTYPVGLGRDDWRTPRGTFRVRGKTVNPTWVIPESIRREHIRERDDPRTSIAGGAPDNPLGKYRIELTLAPYSIHGSDIPWGIGMLVSHGCARLYPEDIARLFPAVPVGTPGEFVYQPVKVGLRGGAAWLEAHQDIYKYRPPLAPRALATLRRLGVHADGAALRTAIGASHGMPVKLPPG
jgi:L,D-transpeptidase ErfK/SrfK